MRWGWWVWVWLCTGQGARQGDDERPRRTPADVLREARQRESRRKRAAVIRTVDAMVARGDKITFAAVQRAARVSGWLVYQPEVADYIRAAMNGAIKRDWLEDWDNDMPYGEVRFDLDT